MDAHTEKIILEKLNDIVKILYLSHQKIEYVQKALVANLKMEGKKSGFEDRSDQTGITDFP